MDGSISLAVAFIAGVLSFLSPCVLPLVPGYLGFVTGMSLEELQAETLRRAVLVPALFFVLGFSLVFVLLGASASMIGALLLRYQHWIARVGGVLIVIFGLHLLGVFRWMPLLREYRPRLSSRPEGRLGAALAGVVFAAGWTPCLGPVLSAMLGLASVRATMWDGLALLGGYSLGLAVPFLLAAAATGSFLNTSRRIRRWLPVLERVSGGVLVAIGLMLVTGSFTALAAFFARFTPEFLLERI